MTLDHAVALSLLENLPRISLTERLKNDPELIESASPLLEQARVVRERAERSGMRVVAWNDADFPTALATLTDLPPVLWYHGQLSVAEPPAIAIVGSRAASAVAIETASRLSADVAAAGMHGRQRSCARRRFSRASGRASNGSHHCRAGVWSRPCVSIRAH